MVKKCPQCGAKIGDSAADGAFYIAVCFGIVAGLWSGVDGATPWRIAAVGFTTGFVALIGLLLFIAKQDKS